MRTKYLLLMVVLIILLLAAHYFLYDAIIIGGMVGGGATTHHLVVDTLNLMHGKAPDDDTIISFISSHAKIMKPRIDDRLMYIIKRDFAPSLIEITNNETVAYKKYKQLAESNDIYIYIICQYKTPPTIEERAISHASRGYDDFYGMILANKYHCPIMTADKMRDYKDFTKALNPFFVSEINFYSKDRKIETIMPNAAAYKRLKKPKTIQPIIK